MDGVGSYSGPTRCSVCSYGDCDIRLIGCRCNLHTRCTPLSLILEHRDAHHRGNNNNNNGINPIGGGGIPSGALPPNQDSSSSTVRCRFCNTVGNVGIYITPLRFDMLEKSITLRNENSHSAESSTAGSGAGSTNGSTNNDSCSESSSTKKRGRERSGEDTPYGLSSYIVYCQGRTAFSNGLADDELHRTGRWNDDEVEFVDQLVTNFDRGLLPLPNGTKLSSFLGDMLLCRASRLTKKMKNAKLSTRSFVLSAASHDVKAEECQLLSALQEHFISSLPSESARLEMRFNLAKQWRTYFSNLCIEVEYPHLNVSEWIASVEELESRASEAESHMRNVRRRRMGLGRGSMGSMGTTNGGTAPPMMMTNVPRPISLHSIPTALNTPSFGAMEASMKNELLDDASEGSFDDLMSESPNDLPEHSLAPKLTGPVNFNNLGDDFDNAMKFLIGGDAMAMVPQTKQKWTTSGNPFLDAIAVYLDERNFPFEYIDCWVPSMTHKEADNELRLLPAGFVARGDQEDSTSSALRAFGEYSKAFSFKPGCGLPGRVFISGKTSWQVSLSEVHPSVFARVDGAKVYGLKTAAAIPFSAPGVGRLVVGLYSTRHLPEDMSLAHQCSQELSKYAPKPKWKLVIEIGTAAADDDDDDLDDPISAVKGLNYSSLDSHIAGDAGDVEDNKTAGYSNFTGSGESTDDRNIETRIISLLGDQMPSFITKSSTTGESSSSLANDMEEFLSDIMGMRLLLLRTASKRSQEQNDAIDILKSSFMNYTEESQRSNSEIAMLLAREWRCLKTSFPLSPAQTPSVSIPQTVPEIDDIPKLPPSSSVPETYMSHIMDYTAANAGEATTMRALLPPLSFALQPTPLPDNGTMLVYDHSLSNNSNNHLLAHNPPQGHSQFFSLRSVSVGDHSHSSQFVPHRKSGC